MGITFGFYHVEELQTDSSKTFSVMCTDIDPSMAGDFEIAFTGENMTLSPAHVALKDIFDASSRGAAFMVDGVRQGPGKATASMTVMVKGQPACASPTWVF